MTYLACNSMAIQAPTNADPTRNTLRLPQPRLLIKPDSAGILGLWNFFNGKAGWILFITRDSDCRVARTETTQKEMLLAAPGELRRSPV